MEPKKEPLGNVDYFNEDYSADDPLDIYNTKFTLKKSLVQHTKTIDETKNQATCHICNASFTRKYTLNRHIASVHEGKKPFQCTECELSFTEKNKLTGHIETVHEKKNPFNCDICGNTYSRKDHLKRHMLFTLEAFFYKKRHLEYFKYAIHLLYKNTPR